ncbi:MAG: discoidin domain-containing protein, partial [Planctomycetes bacterium]|nr:discoidin domain-containing protein [Planctomycetota bacterium]
MCRWTAIGSRALARRLVILAFFALAAAPARAADARAEIEAEWARHDESSMREIREAGLVRFGEVEIDWPGVRPDPRVRVPLGSAPRLDGALDDACWTGATRIPAPDDSEPAFLLSHDGRRFYVAASLPTAAEANYASPPTALDAAGAVDGVKNGRYGFHVGFQPNPWWQVDLGAATRITRITRIVIYNRLDYAPGLHNADDLVILTSNDVAPKDDGTSWSLRYDNKGVFFGGVGRGSPLVVDWTAAPVAARFVRIQIPSATPIFFHLDEVEIYGVDDPAKNIARGRPATQSSLSPWSRGWGRTAGLFSLGARAVRLADGEGLAIRREGGRTTVEAAYDIAGLPGGFPATFGTPRGDSIPLAQGAAWDLAWAGDPMPRFGRNRIRVAFTAKGTIEPVEVAVEAIAFTPRRPVTRTVFRERLAESKEIAIDAMIGEEGPAAFILTGRQGAIEVRDGRCGFIEPVAGTLARAEALLEDFCRPAPVELAALRDRARILSAREAAEGPDPDARKALYREARWFARRIAFSNPALDFDRLIFVKRFTQQAYPDVCLNHMPWVSRPGGDIAILEMDTIEDSPRVRHVIADALGPGHVHGMDLWWDADRVVFGYAKRESDTPADGWLDRRTSYDLRRTEEPIHIFEIGIDGEGLRQVTSGPWSDLDPTYCPGGEIAFTSERCGCSLQCNEYDKDETSCNIY